MKCECGNNRFFAHQVCHHEVIVNGDNVFMEDAEIYESELPFGPYYCTKCGKKYDELV